MDGGEHIVGYEVQFHNGADWGNLTRSTPPLRTFTADNATGSQ